MSVPLKDFASLTLLRKQLKAQQEERAVAELEQQRRSRLAAIEADLFRHSIGMVAPLLISEKIFLQPERPDPIARQHLADEQAALAESLSDDFSIETLLDTDAELSYARSSITADTVRKLRRGHWVIQSQLDLHGMRTDEAREALSEYLHAVSRRGLRCVRIIHGKGLGSINKQPVLKGKVRNWLVQKDEVIAFCQAKASDGGSGALVVLLKARS
ncbi:Smr/MutS family protein [Actimicrobium sp. CCI2.3]|uniref:Smr/MutS family protein n=1 Tax=Actimicrobium sp. CCI2.3 TaxID=3048616 RepID=UPI002AB5B988|nr:Smr/MutS family protein [Actimicrobium sp. CCI2.3]MDY7574367.1 Smr/MutS family protein [Actimicrobium sp. CCI2.3]MEB0023528.1 Smr/MutS family protein [Actimicrobium sp. CCI2.3]